MESFIIGGACLLHVARMALRPPEPPRGPRISYERFTSLPYELQEYIIDCLSPHSIRAVNLTSRYFYTLSTRALHRVIDLQREMVENNDVFGLPLLRYDQRNFVSTILNKPRHARWVQTLYWEMVGAVGDMNLTPMDLPPRQPQRKFVWQRDFGTDVWRAFRRLKSVKVLDFRGGRWPHTLPWSSPRKPLFPVLRSATVRGVLPHKALDAMLHTSNSLQHLTLLPDLCEQSADVMSTTKNPLTSTDHKFTECVSIASFLRRSIEAGAFRNLRQLHFYGSVPVTDEAMRLAPSEMRPFFEYLSDWLEVLLVSVMDRQEEWNEMLTETLLSGNWRQLRQLVIAPTPPRHKMERILKSCPRLQDTW